MEKLGFISGAHAKILVHFGVLLLDFQSLVVWQVGYLSGVKIQKSFYWRFIFE
jgi:hypothetical protein